MMERSDKLMLLASSVFVLIMLSVLIIRDKRLRIDYEERPKYAQGMRELESDGVLRVQPIQIVPKKKKGSESISKIAFFSID